MNSLPVSDPTRLMSDLDFVRSLARHLCRDEHEADDVAQDAMLRALEKRPVDVASWRGWLSVVTRNLALNRRRGAQRRVAREQDVARDLSVPSAGEVAEQEQLRKRVVDAVMELPIDFRSVVLLRHYRGLDTRECAEQLRIPESTVRTRLKRGVDRLRSRLDEEHGGDRKAWVSGLLPFVMADAKRAAVVGSLGFGKGVFALAALLMAALALVAWSPWSPAVPAPAMTGAANAADSVGGAAEMAQQADAGNRDGASTKAGGRAVVPPVSGGKQITGLVHDREGTVSVLAGAEVSMWVGPVGKGEPVIGKVQTAVSDDAGRFAFDIDEQLRLVGDRKLAVFVGADANGYRPGHAQAFWLGREPRGDEHVALPLEPGVFCKGRVVDAARTPLVGASLLMIVGEAQQRVLTDSRGRFVIESLPCDEYGYDRVLLAMHDQHGFSGARHVRVRDDGDTRISDLVVEQPIGLLHGHVRDPNGKGVPGVVVSASRSSMAGAPREDDSYPVDGVRIRRFVNVTAGANANSYVATTDADGYFRFCTMRPGRHHVKVLSRANGIDVEVTEATAAVALSLEESFINVRAVDVDGKPLPIGRYAIYRWTGSKAATAARQYAATGATRELLRKAQRVAASGNSAKLQSAPRTFVVVEMDDPSVGASYGSCYLGPREYQGEAVIHVAGAERVGSLRVNVRDGAGNDLSPVLIKCCRVAGVRAVPIRGLQPTVGDEHHTAVLGDWIVVPKNGVVRDLPVGDFVVEVLAGAQLRDGKVIEAPYLSTVHDVSFGKVGDFRLGVRAKEGKVLTFDLRLPRGQAGAVSLVRDVGVFVSAPDGSFHVRYDLVALDGGPVKFVNGRCRARMVRPVPKGLYSTMVYVRQRWSSRQDITVHSGLGVIPVELKK